MVDFNPEEGFANVYHIGTHECELKHDRTKYDDKIEEAVMLHPELPPKKLKVHLVKDCVRKGNFKNALDMTEYLKDERRVRGIRKNLVTDEQCYLHKVWKQFLK